MNVNESADQYANQYRKALLSDVIPFWEEHSVDREHGGYFTFLDRHGAVFGTDKYVWLQARQVWMFATLYNHLEQRQSWIDHAAHGAAFLKDFGQKDDGTWHFGLSRAGEPLGKPYSIFSDCFAAMAFSEFSRATGETEARRLAEETYYGVLRRLPSLPSPAKDTPDGRGRTEEAGRGTVDAGRRTQDVRLDLPMILCNVTIELDWMLDEDFVRTTTTTCLDQLFNVFLDPKRNVLRERLSPSGTFIDSPNGRLTIPGHGIEAMWFAMEIGERFDDRALIDRAIDVMLSTLEFGWDAKFKGIFYFLDIKGEPVQELEWDQKLWWVHLETLVALAMACRLAPTGSGQAVECWDWYERVHDYTWARFPDPDHGEWWGYLNRRGEVSIKSKGGQWKGCFHVPRALYRCMREFEKMGS